MTVGIFRSIGPYRQNFGAVFAFMPPATVPVPAFHPAFQKHFVRGLTGGHEGMTGTSGRCSAVFVDR